MRFEIVNYFGRGMVLKFEFQLYRVRFTILIFRSNSENF